MTEPHKEKPSDDLDATEMVRDLQDSVHLLWLAAQEALEVDNNTNALMRGILIIEQGLQDLSERLQRAA